MVVFLMKNSAILIPLPVVYPVLYRQNCQKTFLHVLHFVVFSFLETKSNAKNVIF